MKLEKLRNGEFRLETDAIGIKMLLKAVEIFDEEIYACGNCPFEMECIGLEDIGQDNLCARVGKLEIEFNKLTKEG